MKKALLTLAACCATLFAAAQGERPFDVTLDNDEYKISLRLNLYDKNLTMPGQSVLGEVEGYFTSKQGRTTWLVVSSELVDERTAVIEVVNDYGSEDFTAELKANADGTYSYKKKGGSTLKFAVMGKWQKIPGRLTLVKRGKK